MSSEPFDILARWGVMRSGGPSLWLHAHRPEEFARALPALQALIEKNARYHLLLTSTDRQTRHWLKAIYPECRILPPPFDSDSCVRRFFSRTNPHALFLSSYIGLGDQALHRARRWRFPILSFVERRSHSGDNPNQFVDHFVALDHDKERTSAIDLEHAAKIAEELTSLIADVPKPVGAPAGMSGVLRRFVQSRIGRALLSLRSSRIESLEDLSRKLGRPQTILCLGNGPSSMVGEVERLARDALFRVNCRWHGSGPNTEADMVFVGDPTCIARIPVAMFAFRTIEEEHQALVRQLFRQRPWRLNYVTLERLPILLNEQPWGARPTNGVAMVCLAVAMQPETLIIAGIDLFSHPLGSYPDQLTYPNTYLLMHKREVEIAILRAALSRFTGNLAIFGPLQVELQLSRNVS